MDPVLRGDKFNFLNPRRCDPASSPGEGFEPALQSKRHGFQQTPVGNAWEGVRIEDSREVWLEFQSAGDLSQASKENFGAGQVGAARGQVLRIAGVAHDRAGCDSLELKRRGRQARGTYNDVRLGREILQIRLAFDVKPLRFQLRAKPAEPLAIASVEQHLPHRWAQTAGAAGAYVSRCTNDQQGRFTNVPAL